MTRWLATLVGLIGGLLAPLADAATYGAGVLATFEVKEGAGTGNARDCLNATGYGIGVLSLENVPAASTGYRFVKLNRVEGFDAANSSQATGMNGEYEFAFQSVKFTAAGAGTSAVIDAIDALPEREKMLMGLYYEEELNLKEIGAVMGVSESRVSQLHTKAILRLKAGIRKIMGGEVA